jgi:homoserine dehydrogenase
MRPVTGLKAVERSDFGSREGRFYLRLSVLDRAGVMAHVTRILADQQISIRNMIQRGHDPGSPVSVVVVTHRTTEAAMAAAIEAIQGLDETVDPPSMIRIEDL